MTIYLALRVTHILAWVLTFVLLILGEFLVWYAARASTAEQLHARYRWTRRIQTISGPLTPIGLIAGIALVGLGGWRPFAPWLVVSYSLIVGMIIVDSIGQNPWQRHLKEIMDEPRNAGAFATQRMTLRDRRALVARLLVLMLLLSVIVVMNQKPTFGI